MRPYCTDLPRGRLVRAIARWPGRRDWPGPWRGLLELFVGALVVAAQHVGEALVVEDFRRRADRPDGCRVGAVGQIEAAQPVVETPPARPRLRHRWGVSRPRRGSSSRRGRNRYGGNTAWRLHVVVGIVAEEAGLRRAARPARRSAPARPAQWQDGAGGVAPSGFSSSSLAASSLANGLVSCFQADEEEISGGGDGWLAVAASPSALPDGCRLGRGGAAARPMQGRRAAPPRSRSGLFGYSFFAAHRDAKGRFPKLRPNTTPTWTARRSGRMAPFGQARRGGPQNCSPRITGKL